MKAVSPLLQQVVNISSIVRVGTLIFCVGLSGGCLQSRKPYRPLSSKLLGTTAASLQILRKPSFSIIPEL